MASVVTKDDFSQFIVIAKEDYQNLVSFMTHTETMEKITVLRYIFFDDNYHPLN